MTRLEWKEFKTRWDIIREMKPLTQIDLGIIVGLVMGEGYIGLTRSKPKNSQYFHYTPRVEIINTNIKLLEWLIFVTNFGIIQLDAWEEKAKNHKSRYVWRLRIEEMRIFLLVIQPHLVIKVKQTELLLKYLQLLKFNKLGCNIQIPESDQLIRASIHEELKQLNMRGIKS